MKHREVFGAPIGTHQGLAHPLAQSKIEIELARLMTQKAAALYDAGDDAGAGEAANMAKYAAAEAACDAVDRAVQTHGGNGITQEYGVAGAARRGPRRPDRPGQPRDDPELRREALARPAQVLLRRRMTDALVHYRVEDHVATLVLDSQPNRNALSRRLVQELYDGLERAEGDADVKVVLLRAEGRTFCSGADLSEASGDGMEQAAGVLVDLQRRIVTLPKPVVARVHGNVRAGGLGIVAACDIAVSAVEATYAFTEVRLGLTPAAISLTVLPRMTDRSAALTFLTGQKFTGQDAERMGLVTRAVAEDGLDAAVDEICALLAQGTPQGLRETKLLLGRPLVARIDEHGPDLARLSARLFGSEEAREAMVAFLQRPK